MAEGTTAVTTGTAVLEFVDVSKSFRARGVLGTGRRPSITAVQDVSLAVPPGTAVGLIGESGSGKSTLARLALGLIKPDSGEVRVAGRNLAGAPERDWRVARRAIHLIFQDPYDSLSARMRVHDLVAEPLVIHRMERANRRAQILAALERAGLRPGEEYIDRYPHELSGGQRQRVALARALVLEPRLIVADEPTSMLDVSLRAGLLRTMLELRAEHGIAFLFITHDLALARYFCDRLAVMFRGRLVEVGGTDAVVAQPGHPYTRALMQAVRDLEVPEAPHAAVPPAVETVGGCPYRDRCLFAHDACTEEPPMRNLAPAHTVACHLDKENP
jgi:oligopeptide/dipeptide ABC transporter ATP-binding protein